ncbi:MAG TPA: cupin domain-containing protein [Caldimonas sp.]|jgi:mannose-6-phosphate isomerase-like protein (cupin superfamily)|nr:cupin domain-containing protein [Caldimonas sp.]
MAKQFRRLVTGHDANGKSVVIFDGPPSTVLATEARPGATMTGIWDTTSTPASIAGNADAYAHAINLMPPRLGTQCIALELQPEDPEALRKVDRDAAFGAMNAAGKLARGDKARHPYMHATETVDYVIVLKGEVTLILDDSEHLLRAGDVVVQRGTNHAWSNRGTESCILIGMLIDARNE